jgi:hypothetical protein
MTEARDTSGKFLPGNKAAVNSGRPALPDWFKSSAPDALRYLLNVALDDVTDKDGNHVPTEPKLRLQAAERVVERVYGKVDSKMEVAVGVDAAGGTCLQVSFVAADKKTSDDEV